MAIGDFSEFLASLGAFESGINTEQTYPSSWFDYLGVFDPARGGVDPSTVDTSNPDDLSALQYHVHNTIGFLGKYQFGEPLLIDLGYYSPAPTGFYGTTATNEWKGTWTGKNGVNSKEDFMSEVQELAIREAFTMNMGIIEARLAGAGYTIDDFIGQSFSYTQFGETKVAVVTVSGILASAHLQGPGGVANLLLNGVVSHDEYGTNILSYMDKFGDFSSPFGTAANDVLSGSDYNETFAGGEGDNVYTTGDGADKIILTEQAGAHEVVTDFDVTHDVVSLQNFTDVTYADLVITHSGSGSLVTLPNGQDILLSHIDPASLSATNFVKGYYVLGWQSGTGDSTVTNFNTTHDIIDLNYAFASNNLALYEENGSAVIEVVGNNQRLILEGIPLSELNSYNFIKAPHDFATTNFNGGTPPVVDTGGSTNDGGGTDDSASTDDDTSPPPSSIPDPIIPGGDGTTYSFTWNWGSHDVIVGFDVSANTVDLQSFWADYSALSIANNAAGSAVIDLTGVNNQTITLSGVSVNDLSSANIVGVTGDYASAVNDTSVPDVPPPVEPDPDPVVDPPTPDPEPTTGEEGQSYSYTWSWGANQVIDHFNVDQDVVELGSFWTNYSEIDIYTTSDGHAVIDLTGINNQTIILTGVDAGDLTVNNIAGVSGSLSDAYSDASSTEVDDPAADPPSTETEVQQAGYGESLTGTDGADAFAFTWNWGSHSVIDGYDASEDIVDLTSFYTSPAAVEIYNNLAGDAVIDLSNINNQTITVNGVSADAVVIDY